MLCDLYLETSSAQGFWAAMGWSPSFTPWEVFKALNTLIQLYPKVRLPSLLKLGRKSVHVFACNAVAA